MLPPKLCAVELAAAQQPPQQLLGVGLVMPKFSGTRQQLGWQWGLLHEGDFRAAYALTPSPSPDRRGEQVTIDFLSGVVSHDAS
jgi:hypothetical protein